MHIRNGNEFYMQKKYFGFYSSRMIMNREYEDWNEKHKSLLTKRKRYCFKNNIDYKTDTIYIYITNQKPPEKTFLDKYKNRRGEITKTNLVYSLKMHPNLDIILKQLKKVEPTIEYCGVVIKQ